MKTRRIIIAAMAAVLAFTPTAGYTFNNSPEIQNIAAAEEIVTGATVNFEGRSFTYIEDMGRKYVVCDGMRFCSRNGEAVLLSGEDASGKVVLPAELPLAAELEKLPAGTTEYTGKTAKLVEIAEEAFSSNKQITSVTIPDSVEKIGGSAFWSCESLAEINAPDKYINIGSGAFRLTPWYEKLTGSGKEEIFCGNLMSVPDAGEYTIPEGVKTVYHVGYELTKLKKLTIPEGVEYIYGSFNYCENLSNIVLPTSVKVISGSFGACENLSNIILPVSVKEVSGSFDNCSEFSVAATAEEWNKTARYINPDVRMTDNTGAVFFEPTEAPTGIYEPYSEIHGDVKTELKVGESVDFSVTGRAFTTDISRLNGSAWLRDEYAMKLELISTERDMGDHLDITRRYRLTAMEPGTFRFMPYMTSPWTSFAEELIFTVTDDAAPAAAPAEEKNEIKYTFKEEDGADYIIGGGMKFRRVGKEAVLVSGKDAEGKLVIPSEVPLAPADAAGAVTQYAKVTKICAKAFYDNEKITSVTIPDSVEIIEDDAFYGCMELAEVNAPDSCIKLGNSVFNGAKWYNSACVSNESLIFAGNLLSIPVDAEEYTVPEGVKTINGVRCGEKLKKLTIPEGVENIVSSFSYSRTLSEVILPMSLKKLDRGSFYDCSALNGLTVAGKAVEWNKTGRYIGTNINMYDNTGYMFYEVQEEPTGNYEIAGQLVGDVKTDLKVGESTVITIEGDAYHFSVSRKAGDKWISDDNAIKIEEISSVREPGSSFSYTAKYRITAVDPGEVRINVWHSAHSWLDWSMDFNVSDEEYIPSAEVPAATDGLTEGDANCDSKLTVADAVAVLQFIANKEKYPLSEKGIANADIDGQAGITGSDAVAIQMLDAGVPVNK